MSDSHTSPETVCPNTSSKSFLHWLAGQAHPGCSPPKTVRAYLLVVLLTYIPLLVAVLIEAKRGFVPLWNGFQDDYVAFFQDLGLNYALLISLPSLVVLLVSDERLLWTSLEEVRQDKVLVFSAESFNTLKERWNVYFRRINLGAQVVGAAGGVVLAMVTARKNVAAQDVSSWIANNHHLNLAGDLYVYCIAVFYAVIILYVTRCVAISFFLRAVVRAADAPLSILPLHPDRCGGLRPVGRVGLRNQYTLTILGINLLLLLTVWYYDMHRAPSFGKILVAGGVAYLILGPIIFMAPLLPFREAMRTAKRRWKHQFAEVVRTEIDDLRDQIRAKQYDKLDEKLVDRLRKFGTAIDELPIWPFDSATLRKFGAAYLAPTVILPLLASLVKVLQRLFQ